jgi:hypothetical protein
MPNATIVKAWRDSENAYLAVRVAESDGRNVEYIASLPVGELSGKTAAQQKSALTAAAKAVRDAALTGPQDLPITGTVTV